MERTAGGRTILTFMVTIFSARARANPPVAHLVLVRPHAHSSQQRVSCRDQRGCCVLGFWFLAGILHDEIRNDTDAQVGEMGRV